MNNDAIKGLGGKRIRRTSRQQGELAREQTERDVMCLHMCTSFAAIASILVPLGDKLYHQTDHARLSMSRCSPIISPEDTKALIGEVRRCVEPLLRDETVYTVRWWRAPVYGPPAIGLGTTQFEIQPNDWVSCHATYRSLRSYGWHSLL